MDVSISIKSLAQAMIFTVPQNGLLIKGGKKVNPVIWNACEKVVDRYCCYYWKDATSVRYVGSISADYTSSQHRTNLVGRISNYMQNHSGTTNKMVFDNVNALLNSSSVEFGIFRFIAVEIDGAEYCYDVCAKNSSIIQMIEEILICRYRLTGQADWNRT